MSDAFEKLEDFPAAAGEVWQVRERATRRLLQWRRLPAKLRDPDWNRIVEAARPDPAWPEEILRYETVAGGERQLVRPWIAGYELRALLAERRRFSPVDVLELLATLPALLDALGRALPGALLDKLYLEAGALDLQSAVSGWQDWHLWLDPFRVSQWLPAEFGQALGSAPAPEGPAAPSTTGRALVVLVAELLGMPKLEARRFSPIPQFRDAGNEFLRGALESSASASASEVYRAMTLAFMKDGHALPPPTAPLDPEPTEPLPIPVRPGALPQHGSVLRLHVTDESGRAVRMSSRQLFKIGRSDRDADCTVAFLPVSEETNRLTQQLSRVHVVASLAGGRLGLRDGNGLEPSRNGSAFSGQPLSDDHTVPVDTDGELSLLNDKLRLSLHLLTGGSHEAAPPHYTPAARVAGLPGAVWFHVEAETALHDGIWLLSSCGIALDADGTPSWTHDGPAPAAAAFWRLEDGFCLLNRSLDPHQIAVDGQPLAHGMAWGLATAQILQLGRTRFRVSVVA